MSSQPQPAKENKMGVMPIPRLLFTMAAPMMISMLIQALYNVVDSMFVSYISEAALTAVSLAYPVQNLMIAVATGTGVGVNALLSRSLGEKNFVQVNRVASITILLGLSVSFRMKAELFVTWETLLILGLGLLGFVFDTVGGVFFAKFLNLFSKKKVNPMVGAAGISAFPMASRMVHKMGRDEDPYNYLLMHAAGANVSGQIASVIAGGLIITLVEKML